MENLKLMETFNLNNVPDLDVCILGALELFMKNKLPRFKINFKKPLVVGSGNAEVTGRIIFRNKNAVFASESNFKDKLKKIKDIDGVVLISASGEKHAPIIAKAVKKKKKEIVLFTNTENSSAEKYTDRVYIFPKQREPYTYNTSTYLGMILASTKEDPKKIYNYLKKIKIVNLKSKGYYLIVPPEFSEIKRMLEIKFIELFGRQVARDIETSEYIKHATTIVPSDEIFIEFGNKTKFGKRKRFVSLPKKADYGMVMAIAYYIIGKIQKSHYPYFKENIVDYCKNNNINPIVE